MSNCVTVDPRRYFATARRIRIHRIPKSARPNKFQKTRGKIEERRPNAEKQEAENAIQVRRDAWTAKIPRKNLEATTITMRETRREDGDAKTESARLNLTEIYINRTYRRGIIQFCMNCLIWTQDF